MNLFYKLHLFILIRLIVHTNMDENKKQKLIFDVKMFIACWRKRNPNQNSISFLRIEKREILLNIKQNYK